jgi:hypothetical protein
MQLAKEKSNSKSSMAPKKNILWTICDKITKEIFFSGKLSVIQMSISIHNPKIQPNMLNMTCRRIKDDETI